VNDRVRKPGVVYKPNSTLRSIGALCAVKRLEENKKGEPVFRNFANPKIRAIVTLNMDALLETYMYAFTTKHLLRTVERASADPYESTINSYHMHGYLHFNPKEKSQERDAVDSVVLTEQDYYDFFNKPNSLFNYTFLHLLREYSCLGIGLSMQDENIRRLFHYSKLERMQALANKKGVSMEELREMKPLIEREIKRHFVILKRDENPQMNQATTDTLGALGVNVLWVDEHFDVPVLLEKLYTSLPEDKDHWLDVFGRDRNEINI